ncbi:MAG: hypothetical protein LBS77_07155 [Desulfovibrio sp.]|nr:hypothetical protein [Desulfovibrio sp.]
MSLQDRLAVRALEADSSSSGEQAGFVNLSERRICMAGGAFCVNASRAFGALMAEAVDGPVSLVAKRRVWLVEEGE